MNLKTMREQVRHVAAAWREQYGTGRWPDNKAKQDIQRKLDALDVETATDVDVAEIIGNKSWAEPQTCAECGVATWETVELGEPPDYESNTAIICVTCLRKAIALIDG